MSELLTNMKLEYRKSKLKSILRFGFNVAKKAIKHFVSVKDKAQLSGKLLALLIAA